MEKDNLNFSDMFKDMNPEERKAMLKIADLILDKMSEKDPKAKLIKMYGDISDVEHNAILYATDVNNVEDEELNKRAETLCNIFEQYINILKDFQKGN